VVTFNRQQGIRVNDPTSDAERYEVAEACALRLTIRMPVVVDAIDDRVARAYGALPDRLYLIGKGGYVAFQGDEGPIGFRPKDLETAIERELDRS
ncbi:MAG: deiodinase-like protein, partial [Acidimicrobiia bacterium]